MLEQILAEHGGRVVTGLFAVISGIVGVVGTYVYQTRVADKKIEAGNRRAVADYFLQKKADGLVNLLGSTEKVYAKTIERARIVSEGRKPSVEQTEEAVEALSEFERAIRINRVFLDQEANKNAKHMLDMCRRHILHSSYNQLPSYSQNPDAEEWEEVKQTFIDFRSSVNSIINESIIDFDQEQETEQSKDTGG
ncbi:hypothetical protein [Halorubrum sp. CBA1229]|uniref:hypothetical protein n=1 Tax=Halorubrum sp. CBA1229 TaxID=1853699 RepID=UPI0011CDEE10|nr:hypothetical protein [Halorubrum sp. CBA1229]QKY16385.1 hypothetical protein Hrr1229_005645 [Halorubrum sp. CBA1229]